jgi:hypothetical protein
MPVNGFVPVDGFRAPVFSAGETGFSRPLATVFPLSIGFVVFPVVIGLLVFCASDTAVVKVRTRTLRPTSSRRFSVMVDLPLNRPESFNAELLSRLPGNAPHNRPPQRMPA